MKKPAVNLFLVLALLASLAGNLVQGLGGNQGDDYPLLAKRIFAASPNDILINFTDLRNSLRDYVASQGERVGVYFEYLPTGVSIGVNDRTDFFRSDLVQLPVVIRAYKLIEGGKLDLEKELKDEGEPTGITVSKAVDLVLTQSDKKAFFLLADEINGTEQLNLSTSEGNEVITRELYDYLDIPVADKGETQFISPKSFASILKSLYFSPYLSYAHSSEILSKLTQSNFNDWLPQPVSGDIKVAHKYGYFESGNVNIVKVYSDCGIFYAPERPYLLCVMVNSGDRERSVKHIRSISKTVYDYVNQ